MGEPFFNQPNDTAATAPSHGDAWAFQRWHGWLLLVGLALRLGLSLMISKEASFGGWDGREYHAYAQSLLAGQWDDYPRYFNLIRAPLYPIFLMPLVAINPTLVWPIQLVQSLLGGVQAWALAHIAGCWAGQRAGNWAFILALLHPSLIYFCAFILTETLFITLFWLGVACLQRLADPTPTNPARWVIASAVALGLGCLCRPALQLFLIVAMLWIGWRARREQSWSVALARMALFTAIASALLLPWSLRNWRVQGEFSLAPRNAQQVYAFSNSPEYLQLYQAKTKDEYYQILSRLTARFAMVGGAPPSTWMAAARAFHREHPVEWWRLQWYKFVHFWRPWLNPLIFPWPIVLLSVLTTMPLFLLAAAELWRRRRQWDPFLSLLLGVVGIGYLVGGWLFHVQMRYRLPYVDVPFLILTASWLGHVKIRKTDREASMVEHHTSP